MEPNSKSLGGAKPGQSSRTEPTRTVRSVTAKIDPVQWLKDLGYHYNEEGYLRNDQDEPFEFLDQDHYDELGDAVIAYLQHQLVYKYNLTEKWLPAKTSRDKYHTGQFNIFYSKDWTKNKQKALILIQGTGAVRAPQWSRKCCINESLSMGSMFPFVEFAQQHNFSLLIMNPNYKVDPKTRLKIPESATMEKHCKYVYSKYVTNGAQMATPAQDIYIVAHSAGGRCTSQLLKAHFLEFKDKVNRIAFTDACQATIPLALKHRNFYSRRARHWVASSEPLGERLEEEDEFSAGCMTYSAGHIAHEYTTGCATQEVLEYLLE